MLTVDVETCGLDPQRNSIVSIGAVDLSTGDEFYVENRIGPDVIVEEAAMAVNGFTEAQIRDPNKPDAGRAAEAFYRWAYAVSPNDLLLGGQQVGSFDIPFLKAAAYPLGLRWLFGYKSVDLHSVAYALWHRSMSLDSILRELGLEPEPKPHNALVGARLEAQALRLIDKRIMDRAALNFVAAVETS